MQPPSNLPAIWRDPIQGYDPWRDSAGYNFDVKVARTVCSFFEEQFHHSKGSAAGKPFILERWEKQFLGHLFAWKDKNGIRRYRETLLYIPRKNGKTQIAAGLSLLLLVADGEPGADIYCVASDREQAALTFREAAAMTRSSKALSAQVQISESQNNRRLEFPPLKSMFRVLPGDDAGKLHGLNPHVVIADEIHALKNREILDTLKTGMGTRRQPLFINLTTADYDRPSYCNELHDYALQVRAGPAGGGIFNPRFLPVIYEAQPTEDWTSVDVWKAANPNYGVTIQPQFLAEECQKAKDQPAYENTFKRLYLNMKTEQENRWLQLAQWQACKREIDIESLHGERCFGGLDLSTTTDITAFVLWFPEVRCLISRFWVPESVAQNRLEYDFWANAGFLVKTPGDVVDYEYIRQDIIQKTKLFKVQDIAYDPYNSSQVILDLANKDGIEMVEFRQGFLSMNAPSKEFEKSIVSKTLSHDGNPVMDWMVSNASIKEDPSGNIKPVKPARNSVRKIDGVVAAVMAIGRGMSGVDTEDANGYPARGLLMI